MPTLLALLLAALPPIGLQAQKKQLSNGMTVIVSKDASVPGVALDLWYQVGSKDEEPRRTGFAHLFEHLMFMGARYVPYPQFDTIMEASGGTNNASTSSDLTTYHEVGPSNLLETFLWMEADRMATLGQEMTQEKLETQRKVVLNERRSSYEARPYGKAELILWEKMFPEGHPYHWPVIGSSQDLEAATLDDVKKFFARWYVPSNVSLSIVGDVDEKQAFALAEKYFGWLPKAPLPQRKQVAQVTMPADQRLEMTDAVELPRISLVYLSPPLMKPGDADCDLLSQVLARGKGSRLYQKLVAELQIAADVSAVQESLELQSVFRIDASARPGHTTQELLSAIDAELKKIQAEAPTAAEVDAARTGFYASYARAAEGLLSRASMLNRYQHHFGDPTAVSKDLSRYEAATPSSVHGIAKKVFSGHRLIIEVQPQKKEASR
jgi:predicted Zn-dependent peptidase